MSKQYDKVIQGQLVLENEVTFGEIGINNGKIVEINIDQPRLVGKEVLDFSDQYIFPGMIDVHVHCYSNTQEGFIPTSRAAAVGGVTTFLDMPYDVPNPINNTDIFKEKVSKLEKEAVVDIGLWATISKRNGTDQIKPLAEAGAMAFKMSTFETDEHRFPRIPDPEIIKAMEELKETGLLGAFHSENDDIINQMIEDYQKENKVYPAAHMETRPPVTETSAVLKLLEFAYWTGAKLHIVHVSHPRTIQLIEMFKSFGVKVTSETCYPYLLLDVNDLEKFGPKAKNNPPLRKPEEREGLWEQIYAEKIEMITSDHAPWPRETKERGNDNIFLATSGMPGVEIMVPLMFNSTVAKGKLTPVQFAKLMSTHPAEVFQIPNKGKIKEGFDADFTIIDPKKEFKINEDAFQSTAKLSPFHGQKGKGKIVQTIVRGSTVYDGDAVTVEPGFGKFVAGSASKEESEVVFK
ncbi:dihydroorotase family protein [Bacillus sp. 03113]|uniref:dihydroorotase n=1 Tax=Bacillus sp. 03113 TaxID=2578211 RepID=UPI00114462AA|nr:dihydroorotase [Bacillus sp. 03113]